MIILGKFAETFNKEGLPSIKDYVLSSPPEYKKTALTYLRDSKRIKAVACGYVYDAIAEKRIPETLTCSDDGVYEWRSDLTYYVDKYNLSLPDDFVEHISKSNNAGNNTHG